MIPLKRVFSFLLPRSLSRLRNHSYRRLHAQYNILYYSFHGLENSVVGLELWHRAAELGYATAYLNIGYSYDHGRGVEVDEKKAEHYYELSAMAGDAQARYNLCINEEDAGNMDRALKHYMISARDGYANSLEMIKELYSDGHATKEDYTKALQLYQTYLEEIKSDQRDKAAAADDDNRYY